MKVKDDLLSAVLLIQLFTLIAVYNFTVTSLSGLSQIESQL